MLGCIEMFLSKYSISRFPNKRSIISIFIVGFLKPMISHHFAVQNIRQTITVKFNDKSFLSLYIFCHLGISLDSDKLHMNIMCIIWEIVIFRELHFAWNVGLYYDDNIRLKVKCTE